MYQKLLFAATLLLVVGVYGQAPQLNLPQGKKYETTTTIQSSEIIAEMEQTSELLYVEQYEIKNTQNGNINIDAALVRIRRNSVSMGTDITDDTDKQDEVSAALKKKLCTSLNFTVNASGRLVGDPGMLSGRTYDFMKTGISLFMPSLIGRPVTEGTSWKDSTHVESAENKSRVNGTFTVKAIEGNTALIVFIGQSVIQYVFDLQETIKSTILYTMKGDIKLDLATGIILESSVTSEGTNTIESDGKSVISTSKTVSTAKTKML